MLIAAFCAGRKYGNDEVLVKEALMEAERLGADVKFFRLRDFEVHPCTACDEFCLPDPNLCPHHKDDAPFLADQFLDADGVIMAGPVYSLTGNSLLFTFRDRVFGPKMDVSSVWEMGRPEQPFVKGRFKARPGALISVGGARTASWTSLNLPSLFTTTFSAQTEVVDYMNICGVADPGAMTLEEEYLARARKLGQNLVEAVQTGDHKWRGDGEGVCPCCHLDMIQIVPGTDQICCPVCGITGTIKVENGVSSFEWPDDWNHRKDNRLAVHGKKTHMLEIRECRADYLKREDEAKENLKKYKEYSACEVKSPFREAKKAELLAKATQK